MKRRSFLAGAISAAWGAYANAAVLRGTRVYPSGSTLDLSTAVASRTTGAAPLYVFFDASQITSTTTTRPFHDVELRWNFGETTGPGVATWGTGSGAGVNSRNTHYGPMAGHVFETPGTYTVTVNDALGLASKTFSITVDDPDVTFAGAKTVCFSNDTSHASPPAGATLVNNVSDLGTCLAYATSGNTVRRLLFERGHTFTTSTSLVVNITGPGHIGATGSGAKPIFKALSPGFSPNDLILAFSNPAMSDWRLADIKLDATAYGSANVISGTGMTGGCDNVLFLRVDADTVRVPFIADPGSLDFQTGSHIWRGVGIVDCTIANAPTGGSYGAYFGGEQLFFAGNNFGGTDSHSSRWPYLGKAVLANNTMGLCADRHQFKIHAPQWGSSTKATAGVGQGYSRWIQVSDNDLSGVNPYQIALGVENDGTLGGEDQRIIDAILERNWHHGSAGGTVAQYIFCAETTSRNNVINLTGWSDHVGVGIARRGPATQVPDQVRVFNNTVYSNSTSTASFRGVLTDGVATNVTVKNCLGYAPNDSAPVMTSGANITAAGNTAAPKTSNPLFVGTATYVGFKIQSGSPAIAAGVSGVPVWSDAYMSTRSNTTTPDVGAAKF